MKKKENRRDDRVRKRKTGEAKETEKKKRVYIASPFVLVMIFT